MKYIEWNKLSNRDFIELLQNIKVRTSIYDDPYKEEYPKILKRIDNILKNNIYSLNGYEIKSLQSSYNFIKSLSSLYKIDELLDNKNDYSQQKITSIYRNIYLYEDSKVRLSYCIGKRLYLVLNNLNNIDTIDSTDKYYEASNYLDNFYNGYVNSSNKSNYIKNLYKSNLVTIEDLNKYFNILVSYYDKSIIYKKFIKVYEDYPIDKILEIDKIIGSYKVFINNIDRFLDYDDYGIEETNFDLNKFIENYNSYKCSDDFFMYLYIHDNVTNVLLSKYINYYKKKYVKTYGNKYSDELNTIYKVNKIYDEYINFLGKIKIQNEIDKDVIDSYLNNNKDLDCMFFDLLRNNKLRSNKINKVYYEELTEEEQFKYSIIINFINNRIVTLSSNELFKNRIILSDLKNKQLYYNYMIEYFYKRNYKPTCKYVKYSKSALSKEDKDKIDEFYSMYYDYYYNHNNRYIRKELNVKEVIETEDVDINSLIDILDKLMVTKKEKVLLEFYRLSPYNITTFYNLIKSNISVTQKIFLNKFYGTFKDDITISELRINDILTQEKISYGLEDGTMYEITKYDKEQVFLLLQEENIPITNRTFYCGLRQYFMDNIYNNSNNKKLIKK